MTDAGLPVSGGKKALDNDSKKSHNNTSQFALDSMKMAHIP